MADNFSLDDILAEIDAKKSVKSEGDASDGSGDFSVTSIISEDKLNAALSGTKKVDGSKSEYSVTSIINSTPRKKAENAEINNTSFNTHNKTANTEAPVPKAQDINFPAEKSESATPPKNIPKTKPDLQPRPPAEERTKAAEEEEKAKTARQTAQEEKSPKIPDTAKEKHKPKSDFFAAVARKLAEPSSDGSGEDIKQKTGRDGGDLAFPESDGEKEKPRKPARRPEYDTQQRKLIDKQLKAEEELDNPEEMIDSLNPLEVKSRAQEITDTLSGDTRGIAGNELKKLAEANASPKVFDDKVKLYQTSTDLGSLISNALTEEKEASKGENPQRDITPTLESLPPVKEYIPQKEKEKTESERNDKISEKDKRSNETLLEKLNDALTRQHKKEEEKRKTLGLSKPLDNSELLKAPTGGLNLNKDKIIQATGVIPEIEAEAKENSKRKLRDFMMDSENEEKEQEDDFDSYDATGQIWSDLCESHKVIRIRLFLLLAITLFMGFVALMGDLGNGMVFKLFGSNVTFLDRREDVQGYLFYSLVMGVLGCVVCGSVLSGGIVKLFKLKADCDSVCAVTAVASLIVTTVNISNSDYVLLSYAFVLIPVAIAGLMFNTLGKLMMITRAKRNFRFISGDGAKYSALLVDEQPASALTKGVVKELPRLAAIKKTELLTDFLKSSYCEDKADKISRKLVPAALGAALISAVVSYIIPFGLPGLSQNIYYALTVFTAVLSLASPFSVMFVVNAPLTKAGKSLAKTDSVILGYQAAEEFSEVNSVMIDASLLFPPGTVIYTNIKHYKQPNSINNIALDQAIILAASLAIKSGSVMSNMFRNMINDKDDILVKVENCVYEDNLGVLGWYGNKRMILGGKEQMKRHDIKLPDMRKYNKYVTDSTETIFLSVGGEIVIMFFVELLANQEVKNSLQQLTQNGVSVVIKTTDSIVTVSKIAEVFEIPPEQIRVLPYSMHEQYNGFTHYVPKGSGAVSCGGTFTGFSKAIISAKKLMKDIGLGCWTMIIGAVLGAVCAAAAAWTGNTQLLCPSLILGWNIAWLIIAITVESVRRYR